MALAQYNGPTYKNHALDHAKTVMRSQMAAVHPALWDDYQHVLLGQAIYLPYFFCEAKDFSHLLKLTQDLQSNVKDGMTTWSKHMKHESPDFSETFREVVAKMALYFDVEVYASRLNFYADSSAWKPFHRDSHAYSGKGQREDFTMGASFGALRQLDFLHEASGQVFSFPQHNGDVFAFTDTLNKCFLHGVPLSRVTTGPRFSIIAWGRRRTINERNGGTSETIVQEPAKNLPRQNVTPLVSTQPQPEEKEHAIAMEEVVEMVQKFVLSNQATPAQSASKPPPQTATKKSQQPKKSRVQGAWGSSGRGRGQGYGAKPRAAPKQMDDEDDSNV